ncbi:hypothetical protein [Acidiferrobacter sp.]|uniref:hypothetical protein n=1 Tax=Acidiferrobacter sp. TaxID=1872107 RepID=UPI00261E057F|nr:hypothetical protein [Acidiferrobacter sp.]
MKERKPAVITLRVVAHRSGLNRHYRLNPRQWRTAIVLGAGLVPLVLAWGVFGILRDLAPASFGAQAGARPAAVVRAEVASLARDTSAGLSVMAVELGALNANAVRLARLERQLVRTAGISLARAHPGGVRLHTLPVASRGRSRLITELRLLAQRLAPAAHKPRVL